MTSMRGNPNWSDTKSNYERKVKLEGYEARLRDESQIEAIQNQIKRGNLNYRNTK